MASPPGDADRVFVVEGTGTIRLVKGGVTQAQPFLSIPADVLDVNETGCECGMFSMAFAPDYATSGLFYVFYTRDAPAPDEHFLAIEEFRRSAANPDVADPATRRPVLTIPHFTASNHNGGQLQFGPDGMLYVAVGDGGNTPRTRPRTRRPSSARSSGSTPAAPPPASTRSRRATRWPTARAATPTRSTPMGFATPTGSHSTG